MAVLWTASFMVSCSGSDGDGSTAAVQGTAEEENGNASGLRLTPGQRALVPTLNDFSLSLFQQQGTMHQGKICVLSPIGAAFVLGMIAESASGGAQEEVAAALGLDRGSIGDVDKLLKQVVDFSASVDPRVAVEFASCLAANDRYTLADSYVQALKDNYGIQAFSLNFDRPDCHNIINEWSSVHSHGLITKMTDKLDPNTILCLLNSVYFKGAWTEAFDKSLSTGISFVNGTTTMTIKAMQRTAEAEYCEQNGLKALRLPFGAGEYTMTFLLGDNKGNTANTAAPEQMLSGRTIASLPFKRQKVKMILPVFSTDTDQDLRQLLMGMGVRHMFSYKYHELDGMLDGAVGTPFYVSDMKQKTHIGVDEDGSEGAAVTMAEIMATADIDTPAAQHTVFRADHPFIYFISERNSGVIYFIGRFCGE